MSFALGIYIIDRHEIHIYIYEKKKIISLIIGFNPAIYFFNQKNFFIDVFVIYSNPININISITFLKFHMVWFI